MSGIHPEKTIVFFILAFAAFTAVFHSPAYAQDVEIEVSADLAEITVGDVVNYEIGLTWDSKELDSDPLIEENLGAMVVRDRAPAKRQELEDGRTRQLQSYSITSYKVGEYEIPPPLVRYKPKGQEAVIVAGAPVMLKVRSVAPEDASEIRDIKPPRAAPRDLTKPALFLAGALLGLAIIIVLIVWLVKRSKKGQLAQPPEPPFENAMRRIKALKNMPRATPEEMKDYYVELSSVIRDYLDGRFMLPAPLLTTRQLTHLIEGEPSAAPFESGGILSVLGAADFVKFARYMPDEELITADYERARSFFMNTKPPAALPEDQAKETAT